MRRFLCVAALCCSIAHAADDWRIEAFDNAQRLFADFEAKEAALLTKAAPETKHFYELWLPMKAAARDRDRIAFLYKIKHSPQSIDWSNVWVWIDGTSSTEEEKRISAASPEYAEANSELQNRRETLLARKDLFKTRNQAYKDHEAELCPLESELQTSLLRLQAHVEKDTKS